MATNSKEEKVPKNVQHKKYILNLKQFHEKQAQVMLKKDILWKEEKGSAFV